MHLSTGLKLILFVIIFLFLGFFVFWFFLRDTRDTFISPLGLKSGGPLERYSFENLRKRTYAGSTIKLDKIIKKEINFTSYLFFYESDGKKISGLLNLPVAPLPAAGFPVVVLLRGYVDREIYYTGLGTQKIGEAFAKEGYLTLAPDFIGYGSSDPQLSADILEDRFQKPVEVLDLIASVKNLRTKEVVFRGYSINTEKIGIWGHSNGGQIALSVAEILGMMEKPLVKTDLPLVLWAPVTKGFPEALTDYMRVLDDQGKKVKAALGQFEKDYEANQYSIITYLKSLKAPLQIHQGTGDELVDKNRTDEFVKKLKSLGVLAEYFIYPGADHNLSGFAWQTAASRSLDFFNKN